MPLENPTGGDAGASIQERLESYLAAEDSPDTKQTAGNADASGGLDPEGTGNDGNVEPDANAEEGDKPAGDEQQDDQQPHMTTTDFAKVLGIDESMLDLDEEGNAIIKTKIDGKEGTAKFADVLKSYQLQGHIDNKTREVAEQQRALQQRMTEAEQAATARIEQLDNLAALGKQELMREFQSIDWQTLRVQNPGEYSALAADFQAREARLNQLSQVAQASRNDQQTKQQQQLQEFAMKERERLSTVIPEWKDDAVSAKERKDIKEWGEKNGFEPHELNSIIRAPHVAALRKAMLYDQLQASKKTVENKVRTAPKLVKPGQAQQSSREQDNIRNLKENIRKSGGKDRDVAALLLARGIA